MTIVPANDCIEEDWLVLRLALWPDCARSKAASELQRILESPREDAFLAIDDSGCALGLAEVSLRDYVDGCTSSPVGYLEGIYAAPDSRRQGVARQLQEAAESWAREKGCTEMGSDCLIDNAESIKFHRASGFREIERHVVFLKNIR